MRECEQVYKRDSHWRWGKSKRDAWYLREIPWHWHWEWQSEERVGIWARKSMLDKGSRKCSVYITDLWFCQKKKQLRGGWGDDRRTAENTLPLLPHSLFPAASQNSSLRKKWQINPGLKAANSTAYGITQDDGPNYISILRALKGERKIILARKMCPKSVKEKGNFLKSLMNALVPQVHRWKKWRGL